LVRGIAVAVVGDGEVVVGVGADGEVPPVQGPLGGDGLRVTKRLRAALYW
jgi:hypothetical protein